MVFTVVQVRYPNKKFCDHTIQIFFGFKPYFCEFLQLLVNIYFSVACSFLLLHFSGTSTNTWFRTEAVCRSAWKGLLKFFGISIRHLEISFVILKFLTNVEVIDIYNVFCLPRHQHFLEIFFIQKIFARFNNRILNRWNCFCVITAAWFFKSAKLLGQFFMCCSCAKKYL